DCRLVHAQNDSIGIQDGDDLKGLVEDCPEQAFAVAQSGFPPLAFADIPEDRRKASPAVGLELDNGRLRNELLARPASCDDLAAFTHAADLIAVHAESGDVRGMSF